MKRALLVTALSLLPATALADPCGMVPPVYLGQGPAITRTGAQRTYVFYEDGMETYVIRPGFTGKVDEFGMLIPFPSPPALRKVPDEIFTQIAAAIDPPEVAVYLYRYDYRDRAMAGAPVPKAAAKDEGALAYDTVKVLHEEAVGMYEVVVLAAGSAEALNKWMDKHGFKYPEGMDSVVNDYVKAGWVFVAEKTKVGSKPGSDPQPGMRSVNPSIPAGSSFNGFVQAMGFRFKVDKPVVPMRLSPFNPGDKKQVVYYLTDRAVKIDGIPDDMVVRQLSGKQLIHNLTDPLPLRLYGGTEKDLTPDRLKQVDPQRDPKPHNGEAKDLFASDLLALSSGQLSLDSEEKEKELLRIGEALNMRGPEVDTLHEAELEKSRDETARASLGNLKGMTLSVIAGEFPEDWLKEHDLTITSYTMSSKKNDRLHFDAKSDAPGYDPPGTVRVDSTSGGRDEWYQKIWEEKP